MSKTYALVQANTVVNVIVWDGETEWTPPDGTEAIHAPEGAAIGWTYNGTAFERPLEVAAPQPEPPKLTAEEIKAQLDALSAQLQQLLSSNTA